MHIHNQQLPALFLLLQQTANTSAQHSDLLAMSCVDRHGSDGTITQLFADTDTSCSVSVFFTAGSLQAAGRLYTCPTMRRRLSWRVSSFSQKQSSAVAEMLYASRSTLLSASLDRTVVK